MVAAIEKAAAWTAAELPKLRRADQTTTYNVWGHAYGLRAMSRLYQREADPAKKAEWVRLAQEQVDLVDRYEDINGGWGYLDVFDEITTQKPSGIPTSFTTATVLLAMDQARATMGVKLDEKLVKHSIAGINWQRTPDFSYAYSFNHRMRPRVDINRPAGSLARSQACNAALRVFGEKAVTDEVLITWADRFLAREGFLSNVRKRPVPHEGAVPDRRIFLLLRHLLFHRIRAAPAQGKARCLRQTPRRDPVGTSGKGRLLVGLSALRLPPGLRHRLLADGPGVVPGRTRHRPLTAMPLSREIIERRAIKAGLKASKKRHHVVSEQELLTLRVQTMSGWLRISLVLLGICLLASGWFGWPSESNMVQGLEAVAGIFAILFGSFGVRRTFSHIVDSVDAVDLVGSVLEAVGDAVSNIDL